MKIRVKNDDINLFIPFPSCLVFNRFTAGIVAQQMEQNGITITPDAARAFIKALNHYRRRHPEWVLVEVESSDGTYVKVNL